MNISLLFCPESDASMPSPALCLLSARLKKDGHTVTVFDINRQFHKKAHTSAETLWESRSKHKDPAFLKKLTEESGGYLAHYAGKIMVTCPQIAGFSVFFNNEQLSLELARRLKVRDKNIITVFGGPQCHPHINGHRLIKDSAVDFIVYGEGEDTFSELLEYLAANRDPSSCQGLLMKKDSSTIDTGTRIVRGGLDRQPNPDYSWFNKNDYSRFPAISSKGCINACTFCDVREYWHTYRSMTSGRLFDEIEHILRELGPEIHIEFCEPMFNGNMAKFTKFCKMVSAHTKKGTLQKFYWSGSALITEELDDSALGEFRKSGCVRIYYGIESGSQRILDRMGKNFDIETAYRVIRATKKAGIAVTANFMFGFPGETEDDYRKTLEFLKRIGPYIDTVAPSEAFCSISPMSSIYKHKNRFSVSEKDFHQIYWTSANGQNRFPLRYHRFKKFCALARKLDLNITPRLNIIMKDKRKELLEYYKFRITRYRAGKVLKRIYRHFFPSAGTAP